MAWNLICEIHSGMWRRLVWQLRRSADILINLLPTVHPLFMEAADSFGTSVHIKIHGVTSRKTVIIIVTAVRAFNLSSSGNQCRDEATYRTNPVWISGEGMRFFPNIWIGSGVHSASSSVGTWSSCLVGVKVAGTWTCTSSAPRSCVT